MHRVCCLSCLSCFLKSVGRLEEACHEVEVFVGEGFFQMGEVHVDGVVGLFYLRVVEEFARLVRCCLMIVHGDSVFFVRFVRFVRAYT